MAGLTPVISTISQVSGALSTAISAIDSFTDIGGDEDNQIDQVRRQQKQALNQLKDRQGQEQRGARQDAELDRAQIRAEQDAADEDRRDSLRRAVARQRAQFGASGISPQDGSGEAVLLGLIEESDEDIQKREELDTLRNRALDSSLAQRRQRNVLERTQLAERQRLQRSFL